MKKTIEKKLSLSKTTVSNLDRDQLNAVKGGDPLVTRKCPDTWQTICNTNHCY